MGNINKEPIKDEGPKKRRSFIERPLFWFTIGILLLIISVKAGLFVGLTGLLIIITSIFVMVISDSPTMKYEDLTKEEAFNKLVKMSWTRPYNRKRD